MVITLNKRVFKMEKNQSSDISEDEYKVEAVVDKRTIPCNGGCEGIIGCNCKGRVEYRIKWLGYESECNTWEPLKHLYCEDLIEEFEQKLIDGKLGEKSRVINPRTQVKYHVKSKNSVDKCVSSDEIYSGVRPNKRRKSAVTVAPKQENNDTSKSCRKYERKKSVDFQPRAAQKNEIAENKVRKQYRKRSDAVSQIDPSLVPEKIVGAADSGGELMFLIKWKGTEKVDLVPAREANVKFTDMVVKFYEDRIQWHAGYLVAPTTSD